MHDGRVCTLLHVLWPLNSRAPLAPLIPFFLFLFFLLFKSLWRAGLAWQFTEILVTGVS